MPKNTLYVTGFDKDTTAKELAPKFENFGELVRLDIPPPRTDDGGKFAFVEFRDPESCERALALDGEEGLTVQVARSDPFVVRQSRGSFRGRGGYGYGGYGGGYGRGGGYGHGGYGGGYSRGGRGGSYGYDNSRGRGSYSRGGSSGYPRGGRGGSSRGGYDYRNSRGGYDDRSYRDNRHEDRGRYSRSPSRERPRERSRSPGF